jgi:hypothetical protein
MLVALLFSALVLASPTAPAHVRVLPSPNTRPGGFAEIAAVVTPPKDRCSVEVESPDGLVTDPSLRPQHALGGHITWRWKLAPGVTPGLWLVWVRCARAGIARGGVEVRPSVPAPRLKVLASGFTAIPRTDIQEFAYGAAIKNLSKTVDALSVTLDEIALDSQGNESGVHFDHMQIVPGGATLYVAGRIDGGGTTRMRFAVKAAYGRPARPVPTPTVRSVSIRESAKQAGGVAVAATIHNGLDHPAANTVHTVVFGADGRILGGDYGYLNLILPFTGGNPTPLPAHRDGRLVFDFSGLDAVIPFSDVKRAEVSVEPSLPGCCLLP